MSFIELGSQYSEAKRGWGELPNDVRTNLMDSCASEKVLLEHLLLYF
jgi:hypothetical protein